MHRSSSGSRVSDEYFNPSPSNQSTTTDQLPRYNPQSHVANKERNRLKSAETAVHLIPLLLVLCGIILWFFSSPEIESLAVDGDIYDNGTSDLLSDLELRDSKPAKHLADPDPQEW